MKFEPLLHRNVPAISSYNYIDYIGPEWKIHLFDLSSSGRVDWRCLTVLPVTAQAEFTRGRWKVLWRAWEANAACHMSESWRGRKTRGIFSVSLCQSRAFSRNDFHEFCQQPSLWSASKRHTSREPGNCKIHLRLAAVFVSSSKTTCKVYHARFHSDRRVDTLE